MPSSAPSEVLPLNEDSFVIDLKETENNLLHFSLTGLPALDEIGDEEVSNSLQVKDSSANSAHVPLISRIFENLIGERSLFATSPGPAALAVNSSAGDKRSSKAAELEISLLEVAQHDSFSDCWVVIYDRVYDITDFLHSVSEQPPLLLWQPIRNAPPSIVAPWRLRRDSGARWPRCHVCVPWLWTQRGCRADAEKVRNRDSTDGRAPVSPRNANLPVGRAARMIGESKTLFLIFSVDAKTTS